ncbi:acyltransferase family protein [Vibrio sinaloensis]|uniref:acyltransferase family protein n=1 Tax=Photobacterium sp. (strain ATCC 43367) TaxID=379097 RepID=UPI0022AEC952|nr:acyltransferase family protein [Vibrio sinaloensis]MCZ4294810.1 acyltransferase family protein [Vibrio sinaloensis]
MNTRISNHSHIAYRPDIDGLRAVAVSLVVIYHAFPSFLPGGFIGVDIFFVISGFLITSIILKGLNEEKFGFRDFYLRRINRIFPSLITVLSVSFFVGWMIYLPQELEELSKHIIGGVFFVSNFLLLGESGYFDTAAESKPLLHLWSLGIEEQFYIFWPFILCFLYKIGRGSVATIIAVVLCSFSLNVIFINYYPEFAFYAPFTRFWELAFGSFLSFVNFQSKPKGISRIFLWLNNKRLRLELCSVIGTALLITAVLVTNKDQSFPGWYALLPTTGALLIILAGRDAIINRYILSAKFMVMVGLISFPLYLWHWPLLVLFKQNAGGELSNISLFSLVFTSFVLAWITYRYVEIPLRFNSSKLKTCAKLIVASLFISLLSLYVISQDGVPRRFPQVVQNVISLDDADATKNWRVGTCHLLPKQKYESFGKCESEPNDFSKPTLLLWGDSHAAHLYQGMVANLSVAYRIVQMTASTCPPIANMDIPVSPNCVGINENMRQFVSSQKPDRVVLAAAWDVYDWKRLSSTVDWLKQVGVSKIDLVGPVPRWIDSLPRQLLVYFKEHRYQDLPIRMKDGLAPNVMELDFEMKQFALSHNIGYLSPTSILCNKDGCLTRIGEQSLTAFDSAHLTEDGAKYVASSFDFTK